MHKFIYFKKFAQIYFPYSMQIYPDEFPGTDLNDCPRDLIDTAINCSNKAYPDIYKHYREAKFVQIKHHWMWKVTVYCIKSGSLLNQIFNH